MVIDAVTGRIVFEGVAKPVSGRWGQFDYHAELDFSPLQKTGRYLVRLGEAQSPQFEISATVYAELPDQLLEFMRAQRCGYNPFIWCSNNLVVALVTQELLYERMSGDPSYREFAARQSDWLLGRNPWGFSMFTGIPEQGAFPRDVHLMTNAILKRQVRGALVDGPVYRRIFLALKGVTITEPDPLTSFQDEAAVYHDDIKDYASNEPTMDGTASAILLWALKSASTQIRAK